MPAFGEQWPLVGRDAELHQLKAWLSGTRSAVLAGPAGVGKTRLAQEWLALAEQSGFCALRVTATRATAGTPFGALASLLPAVDPNRTATDNRSDLLRRSANALRERAGDRTLALAVDDAHHLDDASAALIHQLVAGQGAFVLATVRAGEPLPDPVTALWKDELAVRLELRGLDAVAIEGLLTSVLGGHVDPATAAYLADRCQGNVLFLRELVLGAIADQSLACELGVWRHVRPLSPSERMVELVEARLAGLDPAARSLLELVSYGERLGAAELNALGDPALAQWLERQGLLSSRFDGNRLEIRLGHPVYGEVLRSQIPAVEIRARARSLAETVEATGMRRREDPLVVGMWRLDGGGGRPDLMLAAAAAARWHYDFPLAERLARTALGAGAGFEAALLAAQTLALQGRAADAEDELARLALGAADDPQRARLAVARLDNLVFCLGRMDDALRVADEAESTIAEPDLRDEVAAKRAGVLLGAEGPRAAAAVAEPVLRRSQGLRLAWSSLVASFSLGRLGRIEEAIDAAARGHAAQLSSTAPNEWYPWFLLFVRCEALAFAGRFTEAEALAHEQYQEGLDSGCAEARAFFLWHLARTVGDRGDTDAAARHARESLVLFRQLGRPPHEHSVLAALALALALGGHHAEAAETIAVADDLGQNPRWTGTDLLVARAWTAVAAGDLAAGRRRLEDAAALGPEIGDLTGTAAALHGLARLGEARTVFGRIEALAATLEGDLVEARAAHVRALARHDAAALTLVADQLAAMGAHLLAAEAAADAAVALRRTDDVKRASAAEHRAALLARRCPAARTPALRPSETRSRLTPKEQETALLAASGKSNKEIAKDLYLSVRTVENHLQHIYEKLGVSGREELAGIFE